MSRAKPLAGSYNRRMVRVVLVAALLTVVAAGCSRRETPAAVPAPATPSNVTADPQHANVTGPHGDHTPHHGGLVLMNGDIHYEVVLGRDGQHRIWFSDALRNDLPASIAQNVTLEIARPATPVEVLKPSIDDAGESWIATSRPIQGEGVMVKIRYALQGEPHEIEVPFIESGRQ